MENANIAIEFEPEHEEDLSRENFDPISLNTSSDEDEDDLIDDNTIQGENVNTLQDDQDRIGENLNDPQDGPNGLGEELLTNDPQSKPLTEEKVHELIHTRLLSTLENTPLVTEKEICEKERIINPFLQYPKLLLIPNEIEMFASAICVCERKRINTFNLSFVRAVFKIKRG
ncbi:hypothetical protein M0812_24919 [Anaeramoeba flamelloides]|uniref:Uncharacterized protein n=1 Tax=Anaeramoeba flamelloides TaxID=1746091 RepID=A0AAV7YIH2_9EUKA|nr:hypothetical protein M0812_24919 [Anaeramoeba flamelloides]